MKLTRCEKETPNACSMLWRREFFGDKVKKTRQKKMEIVDMLQVTKPYRLIHH
jgi:hypothetical protein